MVLDPGLQVEVGQRCVVRCGEQRVQLLVWVDLALVLGILQIVILDVLVDLACNLRARHQSIRIDAQELAQLCRQTGGLCESTWWTWWLVLVVILGLFLLGALHDLVQILGCSLQLGLNLADHARHTVQLVKNNLKLYNGCSVVLIGTLGLHACSSHYWSYYHCVRFPLSRIVSG